MHASLKLMCAAALVSAISAPAFAAGPGPEGQVMMFMSNGTMAEMAMPSDPMMMKKMMKQMKPMRSGTCYVTVAMNGRMYTMVTSDAACTKMSKM